MAAAIEDNDGPMAVINVTPLVDVMLVLLVIFMITAPILQQGVEVNLPKATTSPLAGSSEQVVVSIDKDSNVFLGAGNKVEGDTLGAKLTAIMEKRSEADQKVYIQADKEVSYGVIMNVMGQIHRSGIEQIGLVSDPDS